MVGCRTCAPVADARGALRLEAVLRSAAMSSFVNDTNFGSMGRNANLPDYSDFIIVKLPDPR